MPRNPVSPRRARLARRRPGPPAPCDPDWVPLSQWLAPRERARLERWATTYGVKVRLMNFGFFMRLPGETLWWDLPADALPDLMAEVGRDESLRPFPGGGRPPPPSNRHPAAKSPR